MAATLWLFLKDLFYSFPVQLLLLSFRRYQFLLFFWVFLLVAIVGKFGTTIGLPAAFLDPEYMGHVGYLSFAVVGIGFGAIFITWNVVMYILHSHRFPFMACLQYPLGMFILNNSIIPAAFLIAYFTSIILFQIQYEYQTFLDLTFDLCGFIAGFSLVLLISGAYFNLTNKNAGSIIEENQQNLWRKKRMRKARLNEDLDITRPNRVDFYLTNKLNIRHTRTIESYDARLHQLVFKRHHWNAFIAFLVSFALIILMGFFIEKPFFQFPIAATSFFFACILMSLFGMLLYWTGGWGTMAIIFLLVAGNQLTKYDLFGLQSRVYGLNYQTEKATYNTKTFQKISSNALIEEDKAHFLQILENWKRKNTDTLYPDRKPKLYFINASVGGSRSAMFVTTVLQGCDSLSKGALFDKTFLISGTSGGMFGVTLLRELFLQKKKGVPINMGDRKYAYDVAKDLLNPIAVSTLSNDILVPFHKFKVGGYEYVKDRGYIFEKFYCRNTGFPFEKTLKDYEQEETKANIPLIIYHTTVMNDSRRFFITPQPVSFLMRPVGGNQTGDPLTVDGIDFCRFFEKQNGKNLLVTSAMRMDATFPLILPNPVLPTEPATHVMDGGIVDNMGVEVTFRFLKVFKDWINENTSGVVLIQIRDSEKEPEPEETKKKTLLSRMFDPIGSIYSNSGNVQNFQMDQKMNYVNEELKGNLKLVTFEYTSENRDAKAAMSFHLTSRDKEDIIRSLNRKNNVAAFGELNTVLNAESKP
ncbi:MAG: hypothetical protein IPP77_04785 [Bacteroidetes bacterium]|nr:hypothetical protein [Bacteroidota bacterium]